MPALVLAVLLTITGNVIKRDGAPVANAHVTATRPGGSVLARATTGADGTFKLEQVDGVIDIDAEADGLPAVRTTLFADEQPVTMVMQEPLMPPISGHPPQPPDKVPGRASGTVHDEANHPVEGARVSGLVGPDVRAITDEKGHFAVSITNGEIVVFDSGVNMMNRVVRLHDGEKAEIVAERRPAIDGFVRERDGKPVPGAFIAWLGDNSSVIESNFAITDAAGRFHVFANGKGTGQLVARKEALPVAISKALELPKDGLHGFVLTMPRGIEVQGVVTDMSGHGIGGVAINSPNQPQQVAFRNWAITASDGSFHVRMNEGAAELLFVKARYLPALVPFDATSSMRPIAVKLRPIVYVRGTLVHRDGSPVANGAISAPGMLRPEAQSNADGAFELSFPMAGTYTITTGLVSHSTTVRAPADDVRLVFDEGLSLRCRVIDQASGEPVTDADLEASEGSGDGPVTPQTGDEAGQYVFGGLRPGAVVIDATAAGYLEARVSAQAGQEEPVMIALSRGHTLRARVRNAGGQPLDRATIFVGDDVRTGTDGDGAFRLAGLERQELTITVTKDGYLSRRLTVAPEQLDAPPLDIVLSSGLTVKGRVVAENGKPAAIAITARSAELGAENDSFSSDANGQFEISGLSAARYDFIAEDTGMQGAVRDVDVEHVREIVIHVTRRQTGTITGHVSGLASQYVTPIAVAPGRDGDLKVRVGDDGTFRIEDLPAGAQKVTVVARNASGEERAVSESVDLPPGGEAHVEIAFGPQRLVRGRVTRAGMPVPQATLLFERDAQTDMAIADVDGRYQAHLESVPYEVRVSAGTQSFVPEDLPYQGHLDARQTVFDVAVETVEVRMHVIDAQTGEPLVEAQVQPLGAPNAPPLMPSPTGADGTAVLEIASGTTALFRVQKDGYGPAFVEAAGGDLVVKLVKAAKVVVRVVDARDGRTLIAKVSAFDSKGHGIDEVHAAGSDGLFAFELAPGDYRFDATAEGFEPEKVRASVPASGEVRIALRRKND